MGWREVESEGRKRNELVSIEVERVRVKASEETQVELYW